MAPIQKPGRSKQDWQTPPELITAVKRRLGIDHFDIDLAADKHNKQAELYYSEEESALDHGWRVGNGWNWLNPPFGRIEPWLEKAVHETTEHGAKTAVLLPASVGSNWWAWWVDQTAHVIFLNGRITFVGAPGPYPKDCALLLYSPIVIGGYEVWTWKTKPIR